MSVINERDKTAGDKMGYAFYFDLAYRERIHPAQQEEIMHEKPLMSFWRFLDCDTQELHELVHDPHVVALLNNQTMMAELYPWQLMQLPVQFIENGFGRFSLVCKASDLFDDADVLKNHFKKIRPAKIDLTILWDGRYNVARYITLLEQWIAQDVKHFSFYRLADFDVFCALSDALERHGFVFYDRFHACVAGHESPYQKHLARYGDVIAWGGQSRVTDAQNITHVRAAHAKNWRVLTPQEQQEERLLFALADKDGLSLADWDGALSRQGVAQACEAGLAIVADGRLVPLRGGVWDVVRLASKIYQ